MCYLFFKLFYTAAFALAGSLILWGYWLNFYFLLWNVKLVKYIYILKFKYSLSVGNIDLQSYFNENEVETLECKWIW